MLSGRADEAESVAIQIMWSLPRVLSEAVEGVPAPSLIWVHGRGSGDMMMDGVPGVRAGDGCGRSFFPGSPPGWRVATGILRELAAGIS
jgi:hypothetical protein